MIAIVEIVTANVGIVIVIVSVLFALVTNYFVFSSA